MKMSEQSTSPRTRTRSRTLSEGNSSPTLSIETDLFEDEERVLIVSRVDSVSHDEDDSGISEASVLESEDDRQYKKKEEKMVDIFVQVFIPFMIAGFGMMAAGLLLDAVQHWPVYMAVTEIFILVPALLGLKGNLEMTLASRLSTAANVGQLESWSSRWKLIWGNMSLIQGQALVVAGFATLFSIVMGRDLSSSHMLLLGASAMSSAAIASAVLSSIMILVILVSHLLHINPDNVATPIAASLGDLVTLGLLSVIAQFLFGISDHGGVLASVSKANCSVLGNTTCADNLTSNALSGTPYATIATSSLILVVLILLTPIFLYVAFRNSTTRSVLFYGWLPVISAMAISSLGGLVLLKAVGTWEGIAIYSPIINGVGGNLVAVQASRISTTLHSSGAPGSSKPSQVYRGPLKTFCSTSRQSLTAILLVLMSLPGSVVFLCVIHILNAGHTTLTAMFFAGYLIPATLQVVILLYVADWLVHMIWKWGFDPDNIAIPFLTALGDLLGTGLLSASFAIMWRLGDRDEDVGE